MKLRLSSLCLLGLLTLFLNSCASSSSSSGSGSSYGYPDPMSQQIRMQEQMSRVTRSLIPF